MPQKKKSLLSIPFIVVGIGLVGMILPVLGDVDNDGSKDSVSKHLMYKFMATQEDSKAKVEAFKDEDEESGDSDAVAPMKQGFDEKTEDEKTEDDQE